MRAAISKEMVTIVENLNGLKDLAVPAEYPKISSNIFPLTLQLNILTYHYGYADGVIDWSSVLKSMSEEYG